jgi:site-specific recombinase XerC
MGAIYRETYTKPMPKRAEVFTRKGERVARWIDGRGRKRTARVTMPTKGKYAGTERIIVESSTYTAKYRDGSGHVVKVATGCRSKDSAESVLKDLQDRADKVRCGAWTAAEDSVLDHRLTPIEQHITAYLEHLRNKRGKGNRQQVSPHHVRNVEHNLRRIVAECGFGRLQDCKRANVERWANATEANGTAARTINACMVALCAFGNWCVERGRIAANPFNRPPKRDEKADRRRERRALAEDELRRLLKVARLRPIAEYGRKVVKHADAANRANKRSRRTWSRAPLTFDDLEAATARGRDALRDRPGFIRELERRGRERQLVYKTLTLTGLRKGELTALRVRHAELDGPTPYLVLDAADEKAGRGAEIPLRGDLANDLRKWLADRLDDLRDAARDDGTPLPAKLPPDMPLLDVPSGLIRILDRDLVAAGIARLVTGAEGRTRIDKRDDRGRTVDVHALRHTFGTHLSRGGVAPRTAQQALRHGSIELTMQTYTDPKLLDVAGALDALPSMPLDDSPRSQRQKASGTDGTLLVPMLVPNAGNNSASGANADNSAGGGNAEAIPVSVAHDKGKQRHTGNAKQRATRLERATFSLEG